METHETRGGPGSSIRAQMSAGGEGGSGTLAGNRQVSFVIDNYWLKVGTSLPYIGTVQISFSKCGKRLPVIGFARG